MNQVNSGRFYFIHAAIFLLLFGACLLAGCEREASKTVSLSETNEIGDRLADEDKRFESLEELEEWVEDNTSGQAPAAVIDLPTLENWERSDLRPLTKEDNGFSVAYDHGDDITVTLYQFARDGQTPATDGPDGRTVIVEMEGAENGIQQAVDLGMWSSADLKSSSIVTLGDSKTRARHSLFLLELDGRRVGSEIYVWGHAKNVFKLRISTKPRKSKRVREALNEFLTAIGKACE